MDIKTALARVVEGQDLSTEEMAEVMTQIMTGNASQAQIGGFLVALRIKGETVAEIIGAVQVMRQLATAVSVATDLPLVDTCGTGGDGADLFNVSTAAAFVVAAAGGYVAKHGNRSVSSSTGSADVLEAAGVNLALTPEQVSRCVQELGVGFMFAPAHHSAMKHAIGPRRELGLRTIFNILGPMTNPAGVTRQVIGVFNQSLCRPVAEVLQQLGSEHVLVVHADDGLDEITLTGVTHIAELRQGQVTEYQVTPDQFGIAPSDLTGLTVSDSAASLQLIQSALGYESSPNAQKAADLIALNAGAAIYVGGIADSLAQGITMAQDALGSGLAREKLNELIAFTGVFNDA